MATDQFVFNVQDYGAVGDGAHDDGPAFQKCIDALAAVQGSNYGEIYVPVPKASYIIQSPVFMDHNNQKMIGGGAGANLFTAWDGFYVGVKRFKPTPLHTPDAFGVLDVSACPAPGYHFGLRSCGDTTAQFQSNGLQYGARPTQSYDYWATTQKLMIEFCIAWPGDGNAKPGVQTFGLGTWQSPSPWVLTLDGNDAHNWMIIFRTQGDRDARRFSFTSPTLKGPFRITIQLDLQNAACSAFVNDVRVPTTYSDYSSVEPSGYAKPWGPGLIFAANDSVPFTIGLTGTDQTIYGLRISDTLRYPDPPMGAKLPSVMDFTRYFTPDVHTIALLELDTRQNGSQIVSVMQGGNVKSTGLIIPLATNYASNITLENLNFQGSWYSGAGIWIGTIFNITLRKVTSYGVTGVTSFIQACTYNVTIEDCVFQGADCAYFGYFQIIRANNLDFGQAGRDAMRLVSCDMNLTNCFVAAPTTDTVFKLLAGGYGCVTRMTNVIIDFEGYAVNKAIVYCENQPYVPGTTLALTDFWIGTVGLVPCILLNDCGAKGTYGKAWLSVENVTTWGPYSSFVETNGPLWSGVVNAYFLNPANLHNHVPTWGPKNNITFTNVG